MTEVTISTTEALTCIYNAINSPSQAGKVWVKYPREKVDAILSILQKVLIAEGVAFEKKD